MNLKQAFLAATVSSAAFGASAATFNFTMPLAPEAPFIQQVTVAAPSFTDIFNFTAPAGAVGVSGSVVSVDITPFFNVDNIVIALFDGASNLVASGATGEASQLQNIPVVAGSPYFFEVQGTVTGTAGGFYTFTALAAPIPEPGTYALLLAGLGVVGFIAARRRKD